ncbi:MAG: hypothetical protein HC813_03285 [Planctomycetes bacterium]|nr:hypothetical protein [Planctomycetota bacterium]
MKRWACLTLLLYLLTLSALAIPTLLLHAGQSADLIGLFYASIVPLMLVVQGALLVVPVAAAEGRPVAKRAVTSAAILAALPMGILLAAFFWFAALILWGEKGLDRHEVLGVLVLALFLAGWIFWAVRFRRAYVESDPRAFPRRIARGHLRGSILAMLIAIPSHILSRQREECCAPGLTLFGLATGLAVALLAFGPGLFFLFARRVREKRPGA